MTHTKWFRQPWVMITLIFTPLSFIGLYLLITDKQLPKKFKWGFFFFFILAITLTVLQLNGIHIVDKYLPFYQASKL